MIFLASKITVAYLTDNQLKLSFYKQVGNLAKLIQSYEIQFSESEVKDARIINPNLFSKKINAFLNEKRLDLGDLIILIPEKTVYLKGFKLTPQLLIPEAKKEFISEIPYVEQDLVLKTIVEEGNLQLIAIEKKPINDLKSTFSSEMANVVATLPLPRIVSLSYPSQYPSFLIFTYQSSLIFLYLIAKTIFFSETKIFKAEEFEQTIISATTESRHLQPENQKTKLTLLNLNDPLLVQKLTTDGCEVKDIKTDGDILQLTASLWFSQKLTCLEEDLIFDAKSNSKPISSRLTKPKLALLSVTILIVVVLVIFFSFKSLILTRFAKPQTDKIPVEKITTPDLTASISATPSHTPVIPNNSNFGLEILNGNGITGDAARFRQILESTGYIVKNTATATNTDFEVTEINAKSSVPKEIISALDKIIRQSYTKTKIATLSAEAQVDIQLILGQKK